MPIVIKLILALLLALVSRENVRQANVPMFEAPKLSRGIVHNVCVSSVVRFRSRVLSPTPNVERRYKLWATRHRTIEESFYAIKSEASREKSSPSLT
jgi:hypothetical protein